MNPLLEKATALIVTSSDIEAKADLIKLVSAMSEGDLENFIALVSETPALLKLFRENIQAKKTADPNDRDTWNKILEKEEELLSSVKS